jgi:8-oxo-dGTP pyrophosphatase MutT (NUDIX family)
MEKRQMYCNNCGKEGHVFRTCKDPIISCGIILLRGIYEPMKLPVDPKTVSVLMVKRKDSMSYVEFIRGKYEVSNLEYVTKLISNMTLSEQEAISKESFETLWTRLWGTGRDTFGSEFDIALDKYNRLDRETIVKENISAYKDPEWGFPKGRRLRGESDLDCGIREFYEETNIQRDAYVICEDLSFTEVFKGTNDVMYKHVYYIGLLHNSRLINLKQRLTPAQRREISAVDWKTLVESKNITRPHYSERKSLLGDIERTISTYETVASKK